MKYFVDVNGRSYELNLEARLDGKFVVSTDGTSHVIDFLETGPHEASILTDGRSTTLWFSEPRGGMLVSDGRDAFLVRAVDERTRLEEAILGRKMTGGGASEVRSIMPGIVTRLLVAEGDLVQAGTPMMCIEAMKMENEIKAERTGVVRKLFVKAGKTVNAGEPLVDLGPAPMG